MSYCKIELDRFGTYTTGDPVTGRVICIFDEAVKVREIECTLEGKEQTKFSKKRGKHTRWFYGNHILFRLKISLCGQGTMESGNYVYPFSFTLPSIAPNSYQDGFGNIRYFITGVVDRPFAFDYTDELTIHVNSPVNLTAIQHQLQMQPTVYQDEKVLCCWCCASQPIIMTMFLERNAFVVGEAMKLKVEINNLSNKNVEELKITLGRQLVYRCDHSSEVHQAKYPHTFTNLSGVAARGQRVYLLKFDIPATTRVENFALCSLISESWVLEAEAVLPACHTNLQVSAIIFLGHQLLDNHIPSTFTPTAPEITSKDPKEDGLPSYNEATHNPSAPPK